MSNGIIYAYLHIGELERNKEEARRIKGAIREDMPIEENEKTNR